MSSSPYAGHDFLNRKKEEKGTALPDEKTLAAEVERTRRMLEKRAALRSVRRK